jgi:D-3-phosphoglycerate dehydrogenase
MLSAADMTRQGKISMEILISTSSFGQFDSGPLELLKKSGVKYTLNPEGRKLTEEEAGRLLEGKAGIIAGTEPLTRRVMESSGALKVISRCGTGMNNVDLRAAEDLGILVYNTPDAITPAVSEMTLALMLSCLRQVANMHVGIRQGSWSKKMGYLLQGKTVGILGLGRIGSEVARLVTAFGASVVYHDICDVSCPPNATCLDIDGLLEASDIVTLHVACETGAKPLIDAAALKKMRNDSILINTSRGELVDESALYSALKSGGIFAAGLDVFREEPYEGPLRELDNVVLTSHASSYARECRVRMEMESAENLIKGLSITGKPGTGE